MSAYDEAVTPGRRSLGASPLARYLVAAALVRGADAAAAVGLILVATSPGAGVEHGARTGGLLAAALTAPHLLGPWVARRLDAARDGRPVLAAAFALYGAALAAAALLLGRAPLGLAVAAVAVAGTCGPLLTGGLSSRLAGIAPADGRGRRRAQGWDAVTYGLAGSAGPALVAAVAGLATSVAAVLALAGAAGLAAVVTLGLPRGEARAGGREPEALRVRAVLRLLSGRGPLRRTTLATILTAAAGGALAVIAVALGAALGQRHGAGAALVAAFGLGNLAGSLAVTAFPSAREPDALTGRWSVAIGAAYALCAAAPTYPAALGAFALAGAANAPFVTATLAARAQYAPAGGGAQVFVSVAGLKVAAASAGAAAAGAALGLGPRVLLLAAAGLAFGAAAAVALDRTLAGSGGAAPSAAAPPRQPGRLRRRR